MGNEATTTGKVGTNATDGGESGEPNAPSNEQGSQGSTQDDGTGGGTGRSDLGALPKWAQELVKDLRSESANYRTQLRSKEKELEKAGLDEQQKALAEERERIQTEADERANARIKMAEIRARLAQERVLNPGDKTIKLIDLDKVTVDDKGEVHGLDEAVEALKNDYPNLIEGANTDPALGNHDPGPPKATMNDVIRMAAGRK